MGCFPHVPSRHNLEQKEIQGVLKDFSHLTSKPSPNTHSSPPFLRYEEEIHKRTTAENEFVVLKKVSGKDVSLTAGSWGRQSFH